MFIRKAAATVARRQLSIHEYMSFNLLNQYGVKTPEGHMATSPEQAFEIAKNLPTPDCVVKAQVLAGGRGKVNFLYKICFIYNKIFKLFFCGFLCCSNVDFGGVCVCVFYATYCKARG